MRHKWLLVLLLWLPLRVWAATDFDAMTLREDCSSLADWTQNISGADAGTMAAGGGTRKRSASGNPGSAWWTASTFGPNIGISAVFTDATHTSTQYVTLWVWLSSPGSVGAYEGYNCQFDPFSEWININRFDNGAFGAQQICDPLTDTIDDGDSIACEKIGSVLKAYVKRGAVWTEECSFTDATYSGVGSVGMQSNTPNLAIDNIRFDTLADSPIGATDDGIFSVVQ